jgi:hypothetical protein
VNIKRGNFRKQYEKHHEGQFWRAFWKIIYENYESKFDIHPLPTRKKCGKTL